MTERRMRNLVCKVIGICPHVNISFPQKPRNSEQDPIVKCNDCGKAWRYSWEEMRRKEAL